LDALRFLARDLKGKAIKMVNSTAVGGGVAEMLNRLVPLLSELEVPAHWDIITGGNDFFEVTKAFHNALHGTPYDLTRAAQEIFLMYNEQNRERLQFNEGMVVIHDPQPVGLIRSRDKTPASWIWRCHIDLSNPDAHVWEFLAVCRGIRCCYFFFSVLRPATAYSAIFVLSLYRPAFGKE
jgi:trehalose synthase